MDIVHRYIEGEDVSKEIKELCRGSRKCIELVNEHLRDARLVYIYYMALGDDEAAKNNLEWYKALVGETINRYANPE